MDLGGPVRDLFETFCRSSSGPEISKFSQALNFTHPYVKDISTHKCSGPVSSPCDEQVLGPMPALKESSPEDDSQADASNTASLYKVPEHVFIQV